MVSNIHSTNCILSCFIWAGSVEKHGYIAVKPKKTKVTYAEATRITSSVSAQDYLISNGGNPGNPTTNPITKLVNVDIKVK